MDTTDPNITFDENGICNHCKEYDQRVKRDLHYDQEGQAMLKNIIEEMKESGKNKKYDCLIGVSGGTDSTREYQICKRMGS
jgi:hypothetical protein